MASRYRLRPAQRLRRNADFLSIRRKGSSYRCPFFALYALAEEVDLPRETESARIGISASKRVGKAVERNLVKRRFREIFRLNQHRIKPNVDMVISIRPPAVKASYQDLEKRFLHALQYNGLSAEKHRSKNKSDQ